MQKTSFYNGRSHRVRLFLGALLFVCAVSPATQAVAQQADYGEKLSGYYARVGNNDSPAKAAGNNIYIKFFEDRWVGMMFVPYPDLTEVENAVLDQVFVAARKQATSAAIVRGKYGLLSKPATVTIERYGYYQDRLVFECGALSPCTIKLHGDYLDLIKPGVINEHIIKYDHVAVP